MASRLLAGIEEIAAGAWDARVPGEDPFVRHVFLHLLETSGSATAATGWQPLHLALEDGDRLVGAAPMYAKSHSWGEYVFDHGWADAYERAGGRYYPKLQVAVPFTPVPGPRLLAADDAARRALADALAETARELGVSSVHVTFCTPEDSAALAGAGFLERRGVQYHWHNRGYGSFDDFLDTVKSSRRKTMRKEREAVRAAGVEIEVQHGPTLDPALLARFHRFYLATVDKRWGNAYLTRRFFTGLAGPLAERVVLVVARRNGREVAAALNLWSGDALYGRLWGAVEDIPFLHFETCYYAAIEFAIAHGIGRVEAGAQGTHKLQRGYEPVPTRSAHWIRDRGFRDAVERFLRQERARLEMETEGLRELLPYRRGAG